MDQFEKQKQIIISVGREFGSGGHDIAQKVAEEFHLTFYDYNLMKQIAQEKHLDQNFVELYDETPKRPILSRTVREYSSSPAVNLAYMQFDFLREKASAGDSFVVVGRCSEEVLKDFDCLVTVFILADMDQKIERICKRERISPEEAKEQIHYENRRRKSYHNYYCSGKWGDSRNYELCINSSRLGVEGTANFIISYVCKRMGLNEKRRSCRTQ